MSGTCGHPQIVYVKQVLRALQRTLTVSLPLHFTSVLALIPFRERDSVATEGTPESAQRKSGSVLVDEAWAQAELWRTRERP